MQLYKTKPKNKMMDVIKLSDPHHKHTPILIFYIYRHDFPLNGNSYKNTCNKESKIKLPSQLS